MSEVIIKTNHHQRELKSWADLPLKARDALNYDEDNEPRGDNGELGDEAYIPRFFEYRGAWYDTQEFMRVLMTTEAGEGMRVVHDNPMLDWDGAQPESYFSAVLLKWGHDWSGEPDYESVIVAYAHW